MDNYRDIAAELRRRIRVGVYKSDMALPSRMELLKEFNVARSTLDRAVALLSASGDVVSRRGSGTYVSSSADYRVAFIVQNMSFDTEKYSIPLIPVVANRIEQRSEQSQLLSYDALIWMQPNRKMLEIARRFAGERPQLVLNRMETDIPGLSFDHRRAFYDITSKRLRECPEGNMIFLHQENDTLPSSYRFEGFVDACREWKRFYELWQMPEEFEQKVEFLRRKIAALDSARPLIIISDTRKHTGAVMALAIEQKWMWKKSHFYSDFDNDFEKNVWGVNVTSFIQDTDMLIREGCKRIVNILNGADDGKLTLIPAVFRDGDT